MPAGEPLAKIGAEFEKILDLLFHFAKKYGIIKQMESEIFTRRNEKMAIKMRVLCGSGKKKVLNLANEIKDHYSLAFNAVDVIPPAYPCDKERIVLLAISAKKDINDTVRLFCKELTKARAQNVALMIDGDETVATKLKDILTEAGTNVADEILYIDGGFPIFGTKLKDEEKTAAFAWVDRVMENLK